jgi:hypothetical protein
MKKDCKKEWGWYLKPNISQKLPGALLLFIEFGISYPWLFEALMLSNGSLVSECLPLIYLLSFIVYSSIVGQLH